MALLTAEEYGKSVDPPVSRQQVHKWIRMEMPHQRGGGNNKQGILIDKAKADAWVATHVPRGMLAGGTRIGGGRKGKSFHRRGAAPRGAEKGKGKGSRAGGRIGGKSRAAMEIAASMSDEDAEEFIETMSAENDGSAGATSIATMAREGLPFLMAWKTAEQIRALEIERKKIEGSLLEVEDVRKTWGAFAIALRRDLDRTAKVVVTRLHQQAGLPKAKGESALAILRDAMDQACLRLSAGAEEAE